MPTAEVVAGIAAYLGGAYDPQFRRYTGNTTAMVGSVRRGTAKEPDAADFMLGQPAGSRTGATVVVRCAHWQQERVTVGPSSAEHTPPAGQHLERRVYTVQLHVFVRSTQPYAEDVQDDVYAIEAGLVDRLRADPELGGAVFSSGEHAADLPGQGIEVEFGRVESTAGQSKSYFEVTFTATEYVYA